MMIKVGAMKPGNNLETAVLQVGVIEIDEGGYQAVIGVGEVGEILVPLDGGADLCRFHVELGVVEADIRPQQRLYGIQYSSISAEIHKGLVAFDRVVDPPGNDCSILEFRLQLQDRVVAALQGVSNKSSYRLVQRSDGLLIEQGGQDDDAILSVHIELFRTEMEVHHVESGGQFFRVREPGRSACLEEGRNPVGDIAELLFLKLCKDWN